MAVFSCPKIVFGSKSLDQIGWLIGEEAKRATIVTDPGVVKLGFVNMIQKRLEDAGLEVKVFDDVESDPSLSTAEKGGKLMAEFEPDWIVAVGGGSCIDAAKGMWVRYENPDMDLKEINPFTDLNLRQKAKLMAVPTTSGTGADSTWAAVLTDKEEGVKLGLASREIIPDVAILDPKLPSKMPKKLTAGSGMDVLGHAFGGYVGILKNDFSDGMCIQAIRMAMEYLPKTYEKPDDLEARERMHNAATIAGLGFGNSQATLEHSIAHAVGAVHHMHHGLAVGIALPYSIQFQSKKIEDVYADLASTLGIDLEAPEEAPGKLTKKLFDLMEKVKVPRSYSETEISEEDWAGGREKVIKNVIADPCKLTSPRRPNEKEMGKLVDCCWKGKEVDF